MDPMRGKFTRIEGRYSQARRLPRLGKIRLGVKVEQLGKESKTFPRETDYFVCPPEVQQVYGEKPTELDVLLPSDDPEIVFPQKLAMYGSGSGLKCHGNGRQAERYNEEKKAWEPRTCPCEHLRTKDNTRGNCTEKSDLMVILPLVSMGGCYQIKTGSVVSTENINSALDMTRAVAGRISLLPMKLRRVAQQMNHDGKPRTHYVLNLILNANWQQVSDLRANPNSLLIPAQYQVEGPLDENPELDPPDVQEVDAETIADSNEQELTDLREKLRQHRNGNSNGHGAEPNHAPAQTGVPPSELPTPPGNAGPPPAGGSQKPSAPKGRPKEVTDEEWTDWQAYFAESADLTQVRDAVLKGSNLSSMQALIPTARPWFLKKAQEEAAKRGLTVEV